MSPIETQLLLVRLLLLLLLYGFLAAVAWTAWRELRASGRRPAVPADASAAARLIVLAGGDSERPPGSSCPLGEVSCIGRDLDNDVVLVDRTVSSRHAVLHRRDAAWWIEDLHSTNGTLVNGQRVLPDEPVIVRSGDVIQLGALRLRLVTTEL